MTSLANFYCLCGKGFGRKKGLRRHWKRVHGVDETWGVEWADWRAVNG